MKKWQKIAVAAVMLCAAVFYLFVPQKAVKGDYEIYSVEIGPQDVTGQLSAETLEQLEALLKEATCTRWKNPLNAVSMQDQDVNIIGTDDDGLCIFNLVGSEGSYGMMEYKLHDGEALWRAVLEILP